MGNAIRINDVNCLSPFELEEIIKDAQAALFAKRKEKARFFHEERVREMENYRRVLEKVIQKRFDCTLATFNAMSRAAATPAKRGRKPSKNKKG